MECHSFPRILVLVLLLSGMCMVMVPSANARRRCQEVLAPHSCNLYNCNIACHQKHTGRQPRGRCLPDTLFNYRCACIFNC